MKLSKAEAVRKADLQRKLDTAYGNLQDAVKTYNDTVSDANGALNTAVSEYNDQLVEVRNFVEDIASAWREKFDGKSESWQTSNKGTAAEELISEWEDFNLDDADDFDAPEAADEPDDPSDVFSDLREESDGD